MDPFRALARQQLAGQAMIGVSGAYSVGTGFGYMREPASPPMLTQQVKGTGETAPAATMTSKLTESYLGLPLWIWLLGAGAAYWAYFK